MQGRSKIRRLIFKPQEERQRKAQHPNVTIVPRDVRNDHDRRGGRWIATSWGFASDLLWRFVWLNSSTVVWVMENRGGGADPPEKWGKVSIFESIVKITLSPFYPLSLSFNIALVTTYLLEPGGMIVTVPEHCSAQLHYGTASSHGFRRGGCCAHLRRGWRGLHCRPSCCCHGHEPRHDDDDVKPRIRSADDDAANGHVSADADECRRWSSRPRGRQGRRSCR